MNQPIVAAQRLKLYFCLFIVILFIFMFWVVFVFLNVQTNKYKKITCTRWFSLLLHRLCSFVCASHWFMSVTWCAGMIMWYILYTRYIYRYIFTVIDQFYTHQIRKLEFHRVRFWVPSSFVYLWKHLSPWGHMMLMKHVYSQRQVSNIMIIKIYTLIFI